MVCSQPDNNTKEYGSVISSADKIIFDLNPTVDAVLIHNILKFYINGLLGSAQNICAGQIFGGGGL